MSDQRLGNLSKAQRGRGQIRTTYSHRGTKLVQHHFEDVPLAEFTDLVFTCTPGGVTIGLCCCVPCLSSAIVSQCLLVQHQPPIRGREVRRQDQLTPYLPSARGEGVGKCSPTRGVGSVSHHTYVARRRGVGGFRLHSVRVVSTDLHLSDIFMNLRPA